MCNALSVLITGAAGGIGRATVQLFAEKGWRVIGVDIAEYGDGFPENGLFIQADISAVSEKCHHEQEAAENEQG